MRLREIAEALGCQLEGDGELEITGLAPIEQAGPSELTFLANPKYSPKVKSTRAGAILVAEAVRGLPIARSAAMRPSMLAASSIGTAITAPGRC